MDKIVRLDLSNTKKFYDEKEFKNTYEDALKGYEVLKKGNGLGNDFLGWYNLAENYKNKPLFEGIAAAGNKIINDSEVLLVIGIGGSYLGARSAIEMFKKYFNNKGVEIVFVGNQISGTYASDLIEYLKDKEFSINVISKSGTTTEPAIAFRIFKDLCEKKYGKDKAKDRIYATTDESKGALKTLATTEGYKTFIVPDDVGGRFSVLTPVGLLPIAAAGINILEILEGASFATDYFKNVKNEENEALLYATIRNTLYKTGKKIEMLVNYEPALSFFSEWWKQLFGESEGKDNKGIFVASASFSTDLHSMGQMIQDGERTIFETVLALENNRSDVTIESNSDDLDGLNFLSGKTMNYVNKMALSGTILAHVDGGVPNIKITLKEITPYNYGFLVYFFELACGISAYTLGVNPFNQPGVEAYKKNMFALLLKPGYEELGKELLKKI